MRLQTKLCSVILCAAMAMSACGLFVPRPERALKLARETAAMSRVRTILTAEVQHFAAFDRYGTLAELGAAGMIPSALAGGKLDEYTFTVTLKPKGFEVTATPANPSMRRFSSYESLEVHETKPAN